MTLQRYVLCALLACAVANLRAQVIADFGSASFNVDTDLSSFDSLDQGATRLSFSGADNDLIIAGTFTTPLDLTGYIPTLALTGTLDSGSSEYTFSLTFYDSSYNELIYTAGFQDFASVSSTVGLTLESDAFGFAASDVIGLSFIANGVGSNIGFTLESVNASAIPEPGTYAAFAGASMLGFALFRRRRR